MIAAHLDRKNRLVTMLVDHVTMTFVIFVLEAPAMAMNFIHLAHARPALAQAFHIGIYDLFCFSLYFNKDIFLGRSIAKRILGFQVVNHRTGLAAGPLRCLVRNLTIMLWPIEVIAALVNSNRRIGDYIAGTRLEVYDPKLPARPHWGAIAGCIPVAMGVVWAVWFYPEELLLNRFIAAQATGAHMKERPTGNDTYGHVQWSYRTGGKIFSSPVLSRRMVLAGSEDKNLYALDVATGQVLWRYPTGGPVDGSPAVMDRNS